jgi:hypothetical protein
MLGMWTRVHTKEAPLHEPPELLHQLRLPDGPQHLRHHPLPGETKESCRTMSARRRGRNEGTIYQRSDRRWVGEIDLGLVNGKRARKHVYGKSEAEALKKLRAMQSRRQVFRSPTTGDPWRTS